MNSTRELWVVETNGRVKRTDLDVRWDERAARNWASHLREVHTKDDFRVVRYVPASEKGGANG